MSHILCHPRNAVAEAVTNTLHNPATIHLYALHIMKIYCFTVLSAPPQGTATSLSSASDLSSFSFYQKGSVGEFMTFFSKTVAERTPQGQRQSVQENNYTAHVYNRGGTEQLAGQLALCWLPPNSC
jgi:hypothetical protein